MANDAFATVWNCASCAATQESLLQDQKDLKLFTAAGPFEFVAMDLLGLLPKTSYRNRHVIVMTDPFNKWTYIISMRTTTASVVDDSFLEH